MLVPAFLGVLRLSRIVLVGAVLAGLGPWGRALEVYDLRCDWMVEPLGIDSAAPRLSWKLRDPTRGARQTAWRILVASSPEHLARDEGDLWDSGKVISDTALHLPFGGAPLKTGQQVFWKARVWDAGGKPSAWSAPAGWTMGIVVPTPAIDSAPQGWHAGWITDPALLPWQRARIGFSTGIATDEATPKWVQLDLGVAHAIQTVRLYAMAHTVPERIGFPTYFRVELSATPDFAGATTVADFTATPYRNSWATIITLPVENVKARYLRVTAPRLRMMREDASVGVETFDPAQATNAGRPAVGRLAFSQIEVLSAGVNVAKHAVVTASDAVETPPWSSQAVVDGLGVAGANPRANGTLLVRREFKVRSGLRRALLFVSGLGHYTARANGKEIGADYLAPGWTAYDRTVLYDTHDITALLQEGENAVGFTLAGGLYNIQANPKRYSKLTTAFRPLRLLAQLRLEYADGSVATIGSDESWKVAPGPTVFSSVYGGEDYDARLEPVGWSEPGFKDEGWAFAATVSGPGGRVRGASASAPPLRRVADLPATALREVRPGATLYDVGQNTSLVLSLRAKGVAGSTVKVLPAELLKEDGTLNRGSVGGNDASWNYTLRGDAQGETWRPRFFYHGGRYLQVERTAPEGAALPEVELHVGVAHSASEAVGEVETANALFNRIRLLVRWAQRSNLSHVLTDCPHRERLGWLEQYHLNGPSLRYEWDLSRLYHKTFDDMADAQLPDGLIPSIAPEYVRFDGGFRDSPEWGSALILAAWQHYVWTGDDAPLREHFSAMTRYVDYLSGRAEAGIVSHGLGDWYDLGPKGPGVAQLTPVALTATAFYFEATRTVARIAAHLGDEAKATRYRTQAGEIAEAFNRRFFDPATATYATGSQTAQALPLVLGLVPENRRAAALAVLVKDVTERGYAVTAGDVGYRYLLRALADGGQSQVIYTMNNQSEKPGYGYQLAKGATSLTEAWDTHAHSSQNHFMLGQILEWMHGDLAGLAPDPTKPGFGGLLIRPKPAAGLAWAKVRHETPRGPAAVAWRRAGGRLTLSIELPANTTAEVWVPGARAESVTESGVPASTAPGVRFLRQEPQGAVFAIGSGHYRFEAPDL